jgi:hypothetical protein
MTVRRFTSLGVTTDSWVHGAGEADIPVLPAGAGATASGTSQLVTEEAVAFAMLAQTLRGTLPK